ncbi:Uncharacterised protein [Klebsiella pneumoniae]|nr:Uncharacterised protein [Klebsiella pneumoniae]
MQFYTPVELREIMLVRCTVTLCNVVFQALHRITLSNASI